MRPDSPQGSDSPQDPCILPSDGMHCWLQGILSYNSSAIVVVQLARDLQEHFIHRNPPF
jgi:hypothetical protein